MLLQKQIINILAFCLILILGLFHFNSNQIKAGGWQFSPSDIVLHQKIIDQQWPNSDPGSAQIQIQKIAKYLKILERHNIQITRIDLLQENLRIDQNTKDPEKLAQIKRLFRGNLEDYLRIYVLPILVNRVFYYDFFLGNPEIHESADRQARELIAKAKKSRGVEFKRLVAESGGKYFKAKVKASFEIHWGKTDEKGSLAHVDEVSIDLAKTLLNYFSKEAGSNFSVSENPISYGGQLLVAKLISKNKKQMSFELAVFEKMNFETWIASATSSVAN